MKKILAKYNSFQRKFLAIEQTEIDGKKFWYGTEISLKNGEIEISNTFCTDEIKDISKHTQLSQASLVLNDDNILFKKLNLKQDSEEAFHQAFPNLDPELFFYQTRNTEHSALIYLCRKNHLEDHVKQFTESKISVSQVSLGDSGFLNLLELSDHQFNDNLNLQSVSSSEIGFDRNQDYIIQDIRISGNHILGFSVLYGKLSKDDTEQGNLKILNALLKKEYDQKKLFKNTLQWGLGFILIALLINFLVFNHYFQKQKQLQSEVQLYTSQKESIERQNKNVAQKEKLVQSILATGNSKNSFYIQEIIKVIPAMITLNSFNLQPLLKTIRKDKTILFDQNVIWITGSVSDENSLSVWIKDIESLTFIDQVTILSYIEKINKPASFEINLKLKDESTE